ncbi:MAG: type II secretion system protein [Patescibacteria group bacterium]
MPSQKNPAFTLIEILIVVILMGILTATVAVSFTRSKDKAVFRDNQTQIINMFQKARSLAISNLLTEGDEAIYYLVEITEDFIYLWTEGEAGGSEELDRFYFDDDITVTPALEVYYFTPYGDVCFDIDCTDTDTEKTFTISSTSSTGYTATISISTFSGLPELVDGEL